jgi:hypothetical protein
VSDHIGADHWHAVVILLEPHVTGVGGDARRASSGAVTAAPLVPEVGQRSWR